jgi:hypothetical protein
MYDNNSISDHVDALSASLADRERPQVANHVRSIAEQTLDAMLRIEELLVKLIDVTASVPSITVAEPTPSRPTNYEDRHPVDKAKTNPRKGRTL